MPNIGSVSCNPMHPHANLPSIEIEFIAAICDGDLRAMRRLVAEHGTEVELTYQYLGRTTRVEVRGTPLSLAAYLKQDEIASFLVRKGARHDYAVESCKAKSFTNTRSVVPIDLATAFELPELASSLMATECVDWLEHNYTEDSESGYVESPPLLYALLESESRIRFLERLGVFCGCIGSRFVQVKSQEGTVEVVVDGQPSNAGVASMRQALRWLWNTVAIPEISGASGDSECGGARWSQAPAFAG